MIVMRPPATKDEYSVDDFMLARLPASAYGQLQRSGKFRDDEAFEGRHMWFNHVIEVHDPDSDMGAPLEFQSRAARWRRASTTYAGSGSISTSPSARGSRSSHGAP